MGVASGVDRLSSSRLVEISLDRSISIPRTIAEMAATTAAPEDKQDAKLELAQKVSAARSAWEATCPADGGDLLHARITARWAYPVLV
jgi:hypothetical protein